ncbi:DUF58 domain-containing protein [Streptomyces sp. RFCAC02]|uniref:DUF58 domain-containing protein n=1 Tax=Streptomyces sp. RFCAC02 TaxID=2499143 RepID=UPI0010224F96|nr:DUF58 domain-containing protein [Streptomyces sp. RFCAC02]
MGWPPPPAGPPLAPPPAPPYGPPALAAPPSGATAVTGVDERGPLRAAFGGLTTRGRSFVAAGLAASLCAYLLGQPDLLRVGMLLALLPVVSVLVVHRTRSRVVATRRLSPGRVAAGSDAQVFIRVENVGRLPSGLLQLQDEVPYVLGPRPRFALDRIEPGGRREVSYRVRSEVRGRYPLGPLHLRLADPFGMVELTRSFGVADLMTVLPRSEPLPPVRFGGDAEGQGDGQPRGLALAGDDDVIPREYRHGDDVRRVHWRSTAHRGVLMVRREEQPRRARCTVLFDARWAGVFAGAQDPAFERAVSGAASAVQHLARQGYEVRLVTDSGGEVPSADARGADSLATVGLMLDVLAGVQPAAGGTLQPAEAALRAAEGGLLVAFTGALDAYQVAEYGRLRPRRGAAVALVMAGHADPMGDARRVADLRTAGWRAVTSPPGAPLAAVWQQAAAEVTGAGGAYG